RVPAVMTQADTAPPDMMRPRTATRPITRPVQPCLPMAPRRTLVATALPMPAIAWFRPPATPVGINRVRGPRLGRRTAAPPGRRLPAMAEVIHPHHPKEQPRSREQRHRHTTAVRHTTAAPRVLTVALNRPA